MRRITLTSSFKSDLKRVRRRNCDEDKMRTLAKLFVEGGPLPALYGAHPLRGAWAGHMDCHLEPDWIVIYTEDHASVRLIRTGTHADIFG